MCVCVFFFFGGGGGDPVDTLMFIGSLCFGISSFKDDTRLKIPGGQTVFRSRPFRRLLGLARLMSPRCH